MNPILRNWKKYFPVNDFQKKGVAILDFGSQYTQLIARRVREQNVYSQILSPEAPISIVMESQPAAIILSGGPSSVYEEDAPNLDPDIIDSDIPILGICYGLHLLAQHHGGVVESIGQGEYGFSEIIAENKSGLLLSLIQI